MYYSTQCRSSLLSGGLGSVGLYFAAGVKVVESVDHLLTGAGATGVFKECPVLKIRLCECGELGADEGGIQHE